jgi:hypothetical protein
MSDEEDEEYHVAAKRSKHDNNNTMDISSQNPGFVDTHGSVVRSNVVLKSSQHNFWFC